ncbi:hypothetical protein GCT13_43640 [Paraburkholderia sp. CNPSo 3157]|uniref:Uncharacterized protein n=1 Tax=Paraburkholderia franconis TaxID=2654983 RepID=A0A7X1NK52_9BURK|nr:hypothetical protein [Paraburkholderia franconis]
MESVEILTEPEHRRRRSVEVKLAIEQETQSADFLRSAETVSRPLVPVDDTRKVRRLAGYINSGIAGKGQFVRQHPTSYRLPGRRLTAD